MPARTAAQQRLFGLARKIQKGQVPLTANSPAADIAEKVSPKTIKDFAETKRKGLRERIERRKVR